MCALGPARYCLDKLGKPAYTVLLVSNPASTVIDLYSMPGHIQSAIAMVEDCRRRLEIAINATGKFNAAQSRQAAVLAQAVKALSSEARLWANQLREHSAKATQAERIAAATKYLADLPVGPRSDAYAALCELERTRPQPLALSFDPAPPVSSGPEEA